MTFWVLSMIFEPGKVKLDMIDYIQQMLDDFSVKFDEKDKVANPAASDLFEVSKVNFLLRILKGNSTHLLPKVYFYVAEADLT